MKILNTVKVFILVKVERNEINNVFNLRKINKK